MSKPDTNQASGDERPRAVQNGMSQEEYDTWMFLADKEALDDPYTYKIKQSDLTIWAMKLIRTEKLKLLAEVRERAIPNPTTPAGDNEFVPLDEIDKLESELKETK